MALVYIFQFQIFIGHHKLSFGQENEPQSLIVTQYNIKVQPYWNTVYVLNV